MTQQMIIGVDFSAAKSKNGTWITEAVLQGGTLTVKRCYRPSANLAKAHAALEKMLLALPSTTVVALDFPFSIPVQFAAQLAPNASNMPDMWRAMSRDVKQYDRFEKASEAFVRFHGEMIRRSDANFGGPFSPVKSINPNMRPMTFHGMNLLHRLWTSKKGFHVPPLRRESHRNGPTLLETMPGVVLRSFGLPSAGYKGRNDREARKAILDGLIHALKAGTSLTLQVHGNERKEYINNADCLDSLAAGVSAAMWHVNQSRLLLPRDSVPADEEFKRAQLEGWIYAPQPAQ